MIRKRAYAQGICILSVLCMLLAGGCGTTQDSKENGPEKDQPAIAEIQKKGELVVGMGTAYPPYHFIDTSKGGQEYVGIDVRLGQKIADKLGVKLKVQTMAFQALLPALTTQKVDLVISGVNPTDERRKNMDFSDVYLVNHNRLIVRKDTADQYKTLDDFAGRIVGAQKSTTQEDVVREEMPAAKLASLPTVPEAILELTQGRLDGVVAADVVAQQYLMMNPDLKVLDITFKNDTTECAVVVNKGNTDFLGLVNEVIAEEKANGDMDKFIRESNELAVSLNKQ